MNYFSKIKYHIAYLLKYASKYAIFKTIYWNIRLRLPYKYHMAVYPKSIIDIHKNAKVDIKGCLKVNASHFNTRKRRYTSELRILNGGGYIQRGDFRILQGAAIHIDKDAQLIIHGNSYINTNSTINCFHHIEIGAGCAISDNVCIHDSDSHVMNGNKARMKAPVIIGNHVWICKNVTILKGVTIGDGAIIGAGSIVSKSIPPRCLAVGNPARVIRENVEWE